MKEKKNFFLCPELKDFISEICICLHSKLSHSFHRNVFTVTRSTILIIKYVFVSYNDLIILGSVSSGTVTGVSIRVEVSLCVRWSRRD